MLHSIISRATTIEISDDQGGNDGKVRLITTKDFSAITRYYQRNRQYLQPWEPVREEAFFTESGWQRRLEQLVQLQKHKMAFYFVIQMHDSDEICGVVNYSNVVRYPFFACHVGYSLDEGYQGRGIMPRALAATNQWMFDDQDMHRIIAAYMPRNGRSAAVLKKCGFTIEGEARDYLMINGQWEDHILTAKINDAWIAPLS